MDFENGEFQRHVPSNPHGYTEQQLEERELFIIKNKEAHPNLPELWSQWMWDWLTNKTEEERADMMAQHKKSAAEEKA